MDSVLSEQLKSEYSILQSHYEAFDARALMIKSWSAPLLAGGLGLAIEKASVAIALVVGLAAAMLWALEVIWKSFQYSYSGRILLIEDVFRSGNSSNVKPFQIYTSWVSSYNKRTANAKGYLKTAAMPFVCLPYLPIVMIGALYALYGLA